MTTDNILKIVPELTEQELAVLYFAGIRTNMAGIDWAVVNAAIIKAHSLSYLTRVKTRAWELHQRLME